MMKLGFIGTGHITSSLVEGLCTASNPPKDIWVSPRNAEKAALLASRFTPVHIARSNQAVVDENDCIFLALRPHVEPNVIANLEFRTEQIVVSLMAGRTCQALLPLVEPAKILVRACPLPPVAQHLGPIAMFPHHPAVASIFLAVGTPVSVSQEEHLDILWALTALISPYYALVDTMIQWAQETGLEPQISSLYVPSMFRALSVVAEATPPGRLSDLIKGSATPGGLNERALTELKAKGVYEAFSSALDSALARLKGGLYI